jgi:hypothetical protein
MRQSLSLVLPALPYRVHALSYPGDATTGDATWRLSVSSSPLGPTSPCMVLCDGTEQAFAPALLRLRPGCIALPADSVAVRTRHHSIPTPDEAELACRVCNETTYFAHIFLLIPLYTLSYHSPPSPLLRSRRAQCASTLLAPARTASHRVALIWPPTTTHVIGTVASKLAHLTLPPLPRTRTRGSHGLRLSAVARSFRPHNNNTPPIAQPNIDSTYCLLAVSETAPVEAQLRDSDRSTPRRVTA